MVALALAFVSRTAAAQVIEPNGTAVPATVAGSTEETLQTYFTDAGENINAVANASITPDTFMPLCDFQATLVLSQSGAMGGLAWYNVPDSATDPTHTAIPTVYLINPFPMTVLGQTLNSNDIRSNPNYAGGLVGFALMKDLGNGPVPVYYSEDTRNAYCSQGLCTSTPGYWKMMLSYASTVTSNEYYMAWEDWEGANISGWPDDGDFNDKVFAITGVTCDGGGVPCQTGSPGVCANGITQCVVGGTPTCTQQIQPSAEKCDNLDNDCNGMVDDGDNLCPTGQVCQQGKCVGPCSDTEFPCGPPLVCVNGLCVDPTCETVTCPVGQICQNGTCTGGCDGVVCPANQICELGVCVDPCAGVTCKGTVCKLGVCIQSCSCAPCPSGQVCAASGACVDTGCDTMTCGAGQVCSKGSCIDSCAGAKCPGNATCSNGQCGQPMPPPATGSGGASATSGAGGMIVTTTTGAGGGQVGSGGATGAGGTIPTGSGGSVPGTGGSAPEKEGGVVSCACTTDGGGASPLAFAALVAFAGAMLVRRRRARR